MKEDSTLYSVSPDAYAEYLEQLSDTDFWNHAVEKSGMSRSLHAAQALVTIAPEPEETLLCELQGAHCVLPLSLIREILPTQQHITLLPDVPTWMLGILSWRSETMASIDLGAYLSMSHTLPLQNCVTLIAQYEQVRLALCVLSINSTSMVVDTHHTMPCTLLTQDGKPPVGITGVLEQEMTRGPVLVLDIPALFDDVVRSIERRDV